MEIAILGIGSVSAAGTGVAALQAALEGNHTSNREPTSGLPTYVTEVSRLEDFVSKRSLRRLDRFARMALLASFMALEDAGLHIDDRSCIGIVLGTAYGPLGATFQCQDTMIADGDSGMSPILFANSVHNALASAISISMMITGPCLTVTAFERTTAEVLRTAALWLQRGRVDYVLAGVGDETCKVLDHALSQLDVRCEGPLVPLELDRCSYQPGEGFTSLLFGRVPATRAHGCLEPIVSAPSPDMIDADLLASHRVIILSANGNRHAGRLYRKLHLGDTPVSAFSSLYGSLPVGLGFDVAIAGVSCRTGWIYPSPTVDPGASLNVLADPMSLGDGERIGCLECSPLRTTLISITRI